jgi:predicted nucleic acid-binding protein
MLVIDASAAVEYLLRTEVGVRIAPTVEAETLIAPALLDAEVLSVLRREHLRGALHERRAQEALEDLRDWDLERLAHGPLLLEAWRMRHNVSGYDALYLAAAKVHHAAVLTADGPLARAPATGVVVHDARLG